MRLTVFLTDFDQTPTAARRQITACRTLVDPKRVRNRVTQPYAGAAAEGLGPVKERIVHATAIELFSCR